MLKTRLAITALISAIALMATQAGAQQGIRGYDGHTVLVTPEGEVLDYMPETSEVIVRTDSRGRRVLIDHYGNLIATEMPADSYFGRNQQARNYDDNYAAQDPYASEDPYRGGFDARDPGRVTGTVRRNDGITRMPLDPQDDLDTASIDPRGNDFPPAPAPMTSRSQCAQLFS